MKNTPIAMISAGGDLLQQQLVVLEGAADPGRGQPEEDEDRREAGDEEQAGGEHPAPAGPLEVGGGDPGDRGEVAGDQRQHAGGEERDEARRERREHADSGRRIAFHAADSGAPDETLIGLRCTQNR